ncbi:50S ribosomal protein L31 [Candidatus Saccharibacteria bacterium]|nr:50S ribosomal protein L31 [Candidatus Saccharibacteria bacterium]
MPKTDLHPKYYPEAKVTCASCKNTFTVGSTLPELTVEVCHNCHPFFTGKEVLIDTEGRVEKFQKKRKAAEARKTKIEAKTKVKEKEEEAPKRPLTLKELLEES